MNVGEARAFPTQQPIQKRMKLFNHPAARLILFAVVLLSFRPCHAQTLSCGEVIHGSIASGAQTDSYSLNAVAGEVIRLTSVSLSGGVEPDITVYNAAGIKIGGFGYNDGFSTLKLTNSGAYTVQIHDRYSSGTGNYSLRTPDPMP